MGTFGGRAPYSGLEAIHPSPVMRDARAGSEKRHGGFGRNQTFGLAVANDWAWVGAAVAESMIGRQFSVSLRLEPTIRQPAQKRSAKLMDVVLDDVRLVYCSRRRITKRVGVLVGVCSDFTARFCLYLNWMHVH
jgi:hypothetical protein